MVVLYWPERAGDLRLLQAESVMRRSFQGCHETSPQAENLHVHPRDRLSFSKVVPENHMASTIQGVWVCRWQTVHFRMYLRSGSLHATDRQTNLENS